MTNLPPTAHGMSGRRAKAPDPSGEAAVKGAHVKNASAHKRAPASRRDAGASLSELLSDLHELHRQSQEKFDQIETLLSSLQPIVQNARDLHLLRPADLAEAEKISERQVARILAKHPRLKRIDQLGRVVVDIAEFQSVR